MAKDIRKQQAEVYANESLHLVDQIRQTVEIGDEGRVVELVRFAGDLIVSTKNAADEAANVTRVKDEEHKAKRLAIAAAAEQAAEQVQAAACDAGKWLEQKKAEREAAKVAPVVETVKEVEPVVEVEAPKTPKAPKVEAPKNHRLSLQQQELMIAISIVANDTTGAVTGEAQSERANPFVGQPRDTFLLTTLALVQRGIVSFFGSEDKASRTVRLTGYGMDRLAECMNGDTYERVKKILADNRASK